MAERTLVVVRGVLAQTPPEAYELAKKGVPAILVDSEGKSISRLQPAAVVDVDVVIETKRGHDNCFKISDKARCIAGGVLEALIGAGVLT